MVAVGRTGAPVDPIAEGDLLLFAHGVCGALCRRLRRSLHHLNSLLAFHMLLKLAAEIMLLF